MNYLETKKAAWNRQVGVHLASDFYAMPQFLAGETSLKEIELALLGDVSGLSVLHLQCHFGQDSLSLARMGAKVTGVDLSDEAIATARKLNDDLGLDAAFICCDIYDLPSHLDVPFDIVFTTYGTIGWLPYMDKWAAIVSQFLKPNGQFIFVDFHPALWMFDNDFTHLQYNYFKAEPIVETKTGTYADESAPMAFTTISWNHSLSEVMGSLLAQGLQLRQFQEYDYSPYNCFKHTVEFEPGKFRINHLHNHLPMVYAMVVGK